MAYLKKHNKKPLSMDHTPINLTRRNSKKQFSSAINSNSESRSDLENLMKHHGSGVPIYPKNSNFNIADVLTDRANSKTTKRKNSKKISKDGGGKHSETFDLGYAINNRGGIGSSFEVNTQAPPV
jgi:hypothetical protein